MKTATLEFELATPSQNEWDRTNRFRKPKIMMEYRDAILHKIGEGPYRKVYLGNKYPKDVKQRIVTELRSKWPSKRRVVSEIHSRRPRRLDADNYYGGCKPLWDGLQWAGWCVTDHVLWLKRVYHDQVIGDPKTVMTVWVPENEADEAELIRKFGA